MRFVWRSIAGVAVVIASITLSCGGSPPATDPCSGDGRCGPTCKAHADCAQPTDKRCGAGRCVEGACELEIRSGPIASQIYGDCASLECDEQGAVVSVVDLTDVYDDGRECSFDYCKEGEAKNDLFPDAVTCPESNQGACYKGDCVECVDPDWGGTVYCGKPGYACNNFWCMPVDSCGGLTSTCGGVCQPCAPGAACSSDGDCYSSRCEGGKCHPATCEDGRSNDKETGIDCGGSSTCPRCPAGQHCVWPSDCESDVCVKGECQAPSCFDGKKNGSEAGLDCGGPCDSC
jgi:hypothetical protein